MIWEKIVERKFVAQNNNICIVFLRCSIDPFNSIFRRFSNSLLHPEKNHLSNSSKKFSRNEYKISMPTPIIRLK